MWHLQNIPRVVHFYWGNDSLSYLRYLTVLSFLRFNPDWQVKIYYPQHRYQGGKTWPTYEHSVTFNGENQIERLKQLPCDHIEVDFAVLGFRNDVPESFKSDFLRWHLLGSQGGVWSDFDILFFSPLDELYLNSTEAQTLDTVICHNREKRIYSVGFLMASENNQFYRYIASKAIDFFKPGGYESLGSLLVKSLFPEVINIENMFPSLTLANLKMEAVYPLLWDQVISIFYASNFKLPDDTIGLHWYAGYPRAGEFENLVTEKNVRDFPSLAWLMDRLQADY